MDNQEAKFILRAYRPSGADASDPTFAEALKQAQRDPEVGKWLEREQALDRAVAQKLRAIVPPAGLRETILTGARVSHPTRSWSQRGVWMGLAASILVLLGITLGRSRAVVSHVEADQIAAAAVEDALHGRHGSHGVAAGRLQAMLSDPETRLTQTRLPIDLAELRATGCRTLSIAGHEVVEVCFLRSGKDFHLYVMLPAAGVPRRPVMLDGPTGDAAAWSDSRFSYVLATTDGLDAIRALL